jgi:hypothetical protein
MRIYILVAVFMCVFCFFLGAVLTRNYIFKRCTAGTCIRGEDGEVYLRMSEIGQKELADPKTMVLMLRVTDVSTRNKQSL